MASEFSPPIDIAKEREMEEEGRERMQEPGTVPVLRRSMEVTVVGQEQWELIRSRSADGHGISAIAREFGLDRKTVRNCLKREEWRPYSRETSRPTVLDEHMEWLRRRAPQVAFSARIVHQELK